MFIGTLIDPDHTDCQSLGFMSFDLGISLNAIIAIGTAVTAIAAWRAASVAKSAAAESSKIAKEQTNALITAAKANALASRIHAYDLQIAVVEEKIQDGKVRGIAPMPLALLVSEADQLKGERKHLIVWLDRQTDAMGVGLGNPCPGSDYNRPPAKG